MKSENIQITANGIQNSLKKYKPVNAITEYVWNGFDAGADTIELEIHKNSLGGIDRISIIDNGTGIDIEELDNKFRPFFQSEKIYDPKNKHSAMHGKNGVGRLTYYVFAKDASWETIYEKNNKRYLYVITSNADTLENYSLTDKTETNVKTGTAVTFSNFSNCELSIEKIKEHLAVEFSWFLELNKENNFKIIINENELQYSHIILKKFEREIKYDNKGTDVIFKAAFICWNTRLSEYSKYYYINSKGSEIGKENTTYNNKGDHFYHSVFIKSDYFDDFYFDDLHDDENQMFIDIIESKKSKIFKQMVIDVNRILLDERRPFLEKLVSKVIEDLDIPSAFPKFNKNSPIDIYRKSEIESLISSIFYAQPKIFTGQMNKEQKKTFIRLLDLIMQSGEVDDLFIILEEILDMDCSEREDLANILKFSHLSNITKTIKLIKDRYSAIEDLKQLVFNKKLKANEVNHLQSFIEQHYWIFGEEYNLLTAAEGTFIVALKEFCSYLHEEYMDGDMEHPDRYKQMDIFAVRQDVGINKIKNIVVELKHPNIILSNKQLDQVKKYMNVIIKTPKFNATNYEWRFYLVGNKYNDEIMNELENKKQYGEDSLVFSVERYKIYVKTWSELFADFEMRYNHLNKQLNLEKSKLEKMYLYPEEVIENQKDNLAAL